MKHFIFHKHESLYYCKYNIILLIRRIILYNNSGLGNEMLHVCENKVLYYCKYNIILLKRRIILYEDLRL